MIHRDPPKKPTLHDPLVHVRSDQRRQVEVWIKRLLADPEADIDDVDPQLLAFILEEVMKQRGDTTSATHYRQAMIDLTPVLAAPTLDKEIHNDLRLLFALPEFQTFWLEWQKHPGSRRGGSHGRRGPNAKTRGVKAVLLTMAGPGSSSLFDSAHASLSSSAELREVYRDFMHALHSPTGTPTVFDVPGYSTATRNSKSLLVSARNPAMKANIEMLKRLKQIHPELGQRLLVDATAIRVWAPQRAPSLALTDEEREREEEVLRRFAPDAGSKGYSYKSGGKVNLDEDANLSGSVTRGMSKFWRGYLLAALVCQATGLVLVWTLIDASSYEGAALVPLLSTLFQLWPDLDAKEIAGDSLYETDEATQLCLGSYGLDPIFRRKKTNSANIDQWVRHRRGPAFDSLDELGRPVCINHGKPMERDYFTAPKRESLGLDPGEPIDYRKVEARYTCVATKDARGNLLAPCGGSFRVPALLDPSRIVRHPFHPQGDPERYGYRQAMQVRLNGIESAWAPLKGTHSVGGGPNGTRIRSIAEHEGFISLAFLQRTAAVLWDQLNERGQAPAPLPRRPAQATVLTGGTPVAVSSSGTAVMSAPSRPVAPSASQRSGHPLAGRRGRGRPRAPKRGGGRK